MIYIDKRVGSAEIAPYVNTQHKLATLKYGDMAFLGYGAKKDVVAVGVERKTIHDLVSSMVSGRLSGHQLIGMLESYDYSYLLVEGLWRPHKTDGILEVWSKGGFKALAHGSRRYMAKEIWNYLNTITLTCGVTIIQTSLPHHTGKWLDATYHWWQKPWGKHRSQHQAHIVDPPAKAYLRRPGIVCRVAKEIPGVGWEKAEALAKHYPTVLDLILTDEEELRVVAGIGKKLAGSIVANLQRSEEV